MRINERRMGELGDVTVLDIEGKMTQGGGDVLLKAKIDNLANTGRVNVLLNIEQLTFVGSSGLGQIVRSYSTLKEKGGRLKLLGPCLEIRELFEKTKLDTILEIFQDEVEAIASYPRRTPHVHK